MLQIDDAAAKTKSLFMVIFVAHYVKFSSVALSLLNTVRRHLLLMEQSLDFLKRIIGHQYSDNFQ